jgi:hypothetical protein
LAESRADYANLLAAAENHTRLVEIARKNLSDARARQAAAHTASVIGRIDGVEAGIRPVGPSRKTITAAGGLAGLIFGCGLVFLFATPSAIAGDENASAAQASSHESVRPTRGQASPGYHTLQPSDLQPTSSPYEQFGMFKGMSLEQAIRSVEPAVPQPRV